MTPIEEARALLPDTFEDDLRDHIASGYVFSTPKLFMLAKATRLNGKDTWYIHSLVGQAGEALKLMPFRLPFLSFARNKDASKRLRFYPTDRVQGLLSHIQTTRLC